MSHAPKRFDFSIPVRVNLYSDTQSKPTPGMKEAMLNAEVGGCQNSNPTDTLITRALLERPISSAIP